MKIGLDKFEKVLLSEINLTYETDSQEYIQELDSLISSMKDLKNSLKSGPERHKNRKEADRMQKAIEAVRFLKRSNSFFKGL